MTIGTRIPFFAGRVGLLAFMLAGAVPAFAQSYINQSALEDILTRRAESLEDIPEVYYEYYVLSNDRNNMVLARNTMYKIIGQGDAERGRKRAKLVELINRVLLEDLDIGDTLVVPAPDGYELDFRAYSPFPRYYPGASDFDKLFIIHKSIQAWAAYEYGRLARWGIVNTGSKESPTPTGRYNFNWKTEYRVSSLSPPGEEWEMYWVFNFHDIRGIHIHQYPMPTGGPTSHGCVRLVEDDAKWIYQWADSWKTRVGDGVNSMGRMPDEPGTTVLVIGEDPVDNPHPFEYKAKYPILTRVELPGHPYDVPPGTPQQVYFDKLRQERGQIGAN
ncbi:MAG TPA: L,D-transpeptidase [Rhodothermales bacterium]